MGKYDEINRRFDKLPATRSERVEKLIKELQGLSAIELARNFAALRAEKSKLEEEVLSVINDKIAAITELLIPAYEEEGVSSLKILETGQTVSVQGEPYATVEDREKLRAWVDANELSNLLTLHPQTLNSMTKQRLVDGEEPPEGVKVWVNHKLYLRSK